MTWEAGRSVFTRARKLKLSLALLLCALALLAGPAGAYDWLQFGGNPQHNGLNTSETVLTPANIGTLTLKYQVTLAGNADGAPVFLQGVTTASGVKDLLFVTTRDGRIIALDAQTGAVIWNHVNGPGTCTINNGASACYTASSPAIDPNRLYVYSYGLDGKVHKYQVGDGTEITTGGWPQTATLKGYDEKGSSALGIATSGGVTRLYVTHGGYPGDNGDYQGHVTAINLSNGTQKVSQHGVQRQDSPPRSFQWDANIDHLCNSAKSDLVSTGRRLRPGHRSDLHGDREHVYQCQSTAAIRRPAQLE